MKNILLTQTGGLIPVPAKHLLPNCGSGPEALLAIRGAGEATLTKLMYL